MSPIKAKTTTPPIKTNPAAVIIPIANIIPNAIVNIYLFIVDLFYLRLVYTSLFYLSTNR